ncbi:hypothetical protein V2I80_07350 [Pseudomonas viridiflava]|uniref:hypothetical protein n=1 Tax=Pseudomonas viridiflava TaxID=33069 RepID=UPI002ECAC360|nr:hypothetical protein [Pseudomonas viridiflava]MEE3971781.1 hypothetical protein [Pseudomonas viridiflava]MEE4016631.1 hypothetical protein [Pseudomonas viridiflava]MEE4045255.1 hypothetical protein [Pseudomonas viridiflava]MEE4081987.1 hypothetical protein [Pseudomonas viridiflava]
MKRHFYSFTFVDSSTGQMAYASVYAGHDAQAVSLGQIAQAKQGAQVSQLATLINCSYLGYMTAEEFEHQ